MSDAMKLAIQITAADMFSGVLNHFRQRIIGAGGDVQRLGREFDKASRQITSGIKTIAVANYGWHKMKVGVDAAADLQESLLSVKSLLWESTDGASKLNREMTQMRDTAIQVSANLPYSATDLANIEGNLLQGGLRIRSIIGRRGAAFATASLAAVSNMDPAEVADAIAKSGHAFQLQGRQYNRYANDLAQVSAASPAKLPELMYGMQFAAPQAHFMGISPRETAILLASASSIGNEAGTSLDAFLKGMTGANMRGAKYLRASGLNFYHNGKFIGMDAAIQELRKWSDKIPSQQQRMVELTRIFQQQGERVAMLLLQTGNKSYDSIKANADKAATLQQRVKIWQEGLNYQMKMLSGTYKSTLADIFQSALPPATKVVGLTNTLVSQLGVMAEKHKTATEIGVGGAAAALGIGALFGVGRMLKGGRAIYRLWKGAGGTAAGIAKGEAIEKTTGVTPVYVVNMPAGLGAGSAAADAAAVAAGSGGLWTMIKKLGKKVLPSLALLAMDNPAGLAIAGGVAGVTTLGFGAYKLYEHYHQGADNSGSKGSKSTLHIKVEATQGTKAKVTRLQPGRDQHISVDAGTMMPGAY